MYSRTRISPYCYNTNIKALPLYANLSESDGGYGTTNTYCVWEINEINPNKLVEIRLNKSSESINHKDKYALEIKYTDNTETITIMENDTYVLREKNVSKVKFRFYAKETKLYQPFLLIVLYASNTFHFTKVIVIVGCTVFGICAIFCIIFWCWGKYLLQKTSIRNSNEIDEIHSTTSNLNNNINNINIINNNGPQRNSNNNSNSKNKKQEPNKLLSKCSILVYGKSTNHYGNSCSICLDEFKYHDKIIRLKCQHIFHENCLKKWCYTGEKCPNCNGALNIETEVKGPLILHENTIQTRNNHDVQASFFNRERRYESNQTQNEMSLERRRRRSQGHRNRNYNNAHNVQRVRIRSSNFI